MALAHCPSIGRALWSRCEVPTEGVAYRDERYALNDEQALRGRRRRRPGEAKRLENHAATQHNRAPADRRAPSCSVPGRRGTRGIGHEAINDQGSTA
jgi:hypothetical protein